MHQVHDAPTWPPSGLGNPTVTGMSNGVRYAYFEGSHRLVVFDDAASRVYATAGRRLEAFSVSDDGLLTFMLGPLRKRASSLRLVAESRPAFE